MSKPQPRRIEVPAMGAEDVVIDDHGIAWTGTEDGSIWRVSKDGAVRRVGNTGGRPLGIELYGEDRLLSLTPTPGLLAMSTTTGVVERLVTEVDGHRMIFCNNAAVASNGDIWFSDSSTVYPIDSWQADFVENTRTGRLLCRRADGSVEVHLDGLAFANGVALAADESFVCVAESGGRTVVRLWLTGERAGTSDLLVDDLPGYPDNIALGSDGLIWVTLASPVDPLVEQLRLAGADAGAQGGDPDPAGAAAEAEADRPRPGLRRHRQRWCTTSTPTPASYHMVTGVREHHGEVWLASLEEPALAVVSLSPAGRRLDSDLRSGDEHDAVDPREGAGSQMGHLEHITGPQDLHALDDRALTELASEIRDELIRTCAPARRPPRAQPRRRRADAWPSTGSSSPRATASSSTPATRPTCTRC